MEPLLNGQCASQSLGPANQLFTLLVQTILAAQCTISPPDMWPKDYGPTALAQGLDEYDFVIVGAGSAGSVVANRLSENPEWKVLLLEAGGDPPIESEIASMSGTLQHSAVDWSYHVQRSSRASLGLRNGTFWPRGRTLGGSGAINGMQYVRGNRRDYDRWKDLGNPEWGWEDVLEYFKKSENMNVPELVRGNGSRYHRTGGYLNIEQPVDDTELNQILRQAAVELKKAWIPDFNQDRHIGYGSSQFTMIGATRCSPAKAFLSPIKHRFNLHVIKHAMVEKVLVDESNVATGVSFVLQNKIRMNAVASKEVIVAAGSINTPQLLMLSGIGRTEELEQFNIPPKVILNVGGNLQDHVAVPLFFKFPNLRQDGNNTFWKFNEIDALYEFTLKNRSRGIGNYRYLDTMEFFNTANASDHYPDAQVVNVIFPKGEGSIGQQSRNFEYIRPISDSLMEAEREASVLCSYIIALNIKSRGKIRLASADPRMHPLIDANYFGNEDDLQILIRAIRIQQQLLGTNAFRTNRGSLHRVNIPDCQQLEYDTDEYWECYVRHMTITAYHPVGTAKMGPSTDPEAVVDSRLRVKGIRGLRVIDASIMPMVVSGNTNAPTIMIGEMGSDFIKREYE